MTRVCGPGLNENESISRPNKSPGYNNKRAGSASRNIIDFEYLHLHELGGPSSNEQVAESISPEVEKQERVGIREPRRGKHSNRGTVEGKGGRREGGREREKVSKQCK